VIAIVIVGFLVLRPTVGPNGDGPPAERSSRNEKDDDKNLRRFDFDGAARLTLWWDDVSTSIRKVSTSNPNHSNIRSQDYAGPESCKKCHQENYDLWSSHAHRWMNALATEETVKGDFSGKASINYRGGEGTFYRDDGEYRMRLTRDHEERVYGIKQTIGSRFFQYYVGVLLKGPEPQYHSFYTLEHVLPFGYWLDYDEWVPVVHIVDEYPDALRRDPFKPTANQPIYAKACSHCHSTHPVGDILMRLPELACMFVPRSVHLKLPGYLADTRPQLWDNSRPTSSLKNEELSGLMGQLVHIEDVRKHVVSFGITCEACHYGAKEHAEGKLKMQSRTGGTIDPPESLHNRGFFRLHGVKAGKSAPKYSQ